MSVHQAVRRKSPLDVQIKANALVKHTIHICSNERVFNPQYGAFTGRIVETTTRAGQLLWEANNIRVDDRADRWARRREYQECACEELDSLLYLIEVAHNLYGLRNGKYENWARMTREVRDLARSWRDSDARRFGHLDSGMRAV